MQFSWLLFSLATNLTREQSGIGSSETNLDKLGYNQQITIITGINSIGLFMLEKF